MRMEAGPEQMVSVDGLPMEFAASLSGRCSELINRNFCSRPRRVVSDLTCQNGARAQGYAAPCEHARPCALRAVPTQQAERRRLRREQKSKSSLTLDAFMEKICRDPGATHFGLGQG